MGVFSRNSESAASLDLAAYLGQRLSPVGIAFEINTSIPEAVDGYPSSPDASDIDKDHSAYDQGYAGDSYIGNDGIVYDEDLHVPCPAHTTERRLIAKVDMRVIPVLCVLYLLAFLDRVNIANARSFGLEADLGLDPTSLQFSTAVVIFFVPYILFEIPSNILLKRFKPSRWLSGCMFMFGLMTVVQGLVQNYGGLLAVRFFLGVFETGMFPGCFYLIGMWYRRAEAQKRYSFFFSSTTLAGAFGKLITSRKSCSDFLRHVFRISCSRDVLRC